jgi:chloramphenicol 3-O-phosphotransferase
MLREAMHSRGGVRGPLSGRRVACWSRCERPDNLAAERVSRVLVARYRGWWDERRRESRQLQELPGWSMCWMADVMRHGIFRCSLDTTLRAAAKTMALRHGTRSS